MGGLADLLFCMHNVSNFVEGKTVLWSMDQSKKYQQQDVCDQEDFLNQKKKKLPLPSSY